VHVSRDDGTTWRNVTPKGLGAWSLVSMIEASPRDAGTAYVAVNRYKLDDFRPYLFRTRDFGRTWTKITAGIPEDSFTRVVRADPERRGLLFAGTETGAYVSFDDGARWQRLGGDLPVVPVHDLVVKDTDLVLGTHGRSFWVLDDITPLREWGKASGVPGGQSPRGRGTSARSDVVVFPPRQAIRMRSKGGFPAKPVPGINYRFSGAAMLAYELGTNKETGEKQETYLDAGKNPPDGVIVQYWLRERPKGEVTLTFLDARGKTIRTFSSKPDDEPAAPPPDAALPGEGAESVQRPTGAAEPASQEPVVPKKAGLNRFVWNMRYPDAVKVDDDVSMDEFERALAGPVAAPGRYAVRLKTGGEAYRAEFETRLDPRASVPQGDLEAQFELLLQIRDKLSETHEAINTIRSVRGQVEAWEKRAAGDPAARAVVKAAAKLRRELSSIEEELIQTKAASRQDTLNFPIKLNAQARRARGCGRDGRRRSDAVDGGGVRRSLPPDRSAAGASRAHDEGRSARVRSGRPEVAHPRDRRGDALEGPSLEGRPLAAAQHRETVAARDLLVADAAESVALPVEPGAVARERLRVGDIEDDVLRVPTRELVGVLAHVPAVRELRGDEVAGGDACVGRDRDDRRRHRGVPRLHHEARWVELRAERHVAVEVGERH